MWMVIILAAFCPLPHRFEAHVGRGFFALRSFKLRCRRTGFRHDLSWIDLPIFGEDGAVVHARGVVPDAPGLYFVGLPAAVSFGPLMRFMHGDGFAAARVVRSLLRCSR